MEEVKEDDNKDTTKQESTDPLAEMKNINDKLKKDNETNFKVNNIFFINNKFNSPIE